MPKGGARAAQRHNEGLSAAAAAPVVSTPHAEPVTAVARVDGRASDRPSVRRTDRFRTVVLPVGSAAATVLVFEGVLHALGR
jgi:hypothetical protein